MVRHGQPVQIHQQNSKKKTISENLSHPKMLILANPLKHKLRWPNIGKKKPCPQLGMERHSTLVRLAYTAEPSQQKGKGSLPLYISHLTPS